MAAMCGARAKTKPMLAADVWRLMLHFLMPKRGRFYEVAQDLGLTPGDVKTLLLLRPGEQRPMGSLAQACACDASNVTWMVDRLEDRGLVERRMLASDRRVKAVALTPLGVTTKDDVLERLYEPPSELLTLDRETLGVLRDALEELPISAETLPFTPRPGEHAGARRDTA
jgi:DNA-binding MarR family transcriptional regulator